MASMIQEIAHVEAVNGPYVEMSIIHWRPMTTVSEAEGAASAMEAADAGEGLDWALAGGEREELENRAEDAERASKDAEERIDELEKEVSDALEAERIAGNERDEAVDKLDTFMNNTDWKVEREHLFEIREAESRALNRLCWALSNWAGRNKQKARVVELIAQCKLECDAARKEADAKYNVREEAA